MIEALDETKIKSLLNLAGFTNYYKKFMLSKIDI